MSYRNFTTRSRQMAARKADQERREDDRFRFRMWKVRHDPGESGIYIPMLDKDGNYQIVEEMIAHKLKKDRRYYACTEDIDGFDGECNWCKQRDRERETKNETVGVIKTSFSFLGVWDCNWWVTTYNKDGRMFVSMWHGRHPGDAKPEDAVLGGARHFRMGPNGQDSWNEYAESLEDVCECVALTNDPELSCCYVLQTQCPDCGCVLDTDEDLGRIGSSPKIRSEILNVLTKCKPVDEGGCWTTEKEENMWDHMFFPEPVFTCVNHSKNPDQCPEPRPLDPFMKPAIVTRVGESTSTTYQWKRDDSLTWVEWCNFEVPQAARDTFAGGMDFSKKLEVLKLNDQLEKMGLSGGQSQRQSNPRSRGRRYR